ATFSKVHCVNYHRCPSQSARPISVSRRFSYAFWQSQFTLLFGKVRKSEVRVNQIQSKLSLVQLQPSTDLTFLSRVIQ
ncbi:TPA: hypothetical protein ACGOWG_002035, partial [Streptococcus suis]